MKMSVDTAFSGKRVLITGTSGFIGKVVLEKLIREVPGISRFVLLLRGSRAHPDPLQRFHAEVLSSTVFDPLRRDDPLRLQHTVAHKLSVVNAEISEPRLGLSDEAFRELASEVDLVINVAASVNFREALDQALAINTFSVQHLAGLAQAAGGAPLLQVSTCYVNGFRRGVIGETLSPPPRARVPQRPDGSWEVRPLIERLQRLVQECRQRVSEPEARTRALVQLGIREAHRHGWNDTYTFTKWLGEQVAAREMADGTLSIVRPAIVESACREPQPGWIEGMKVGDAIVLAYARGKTRLFPARPSGIADIIPCDLVGNAIVLAAAEALSRPGRRRVYQVGSSTRNPIRVGDYVRLCQTEMRENARAYPRLIRKPLDKAFRTIPRPLFLGYLGAACAAVGAASQVARWLGMSGRLAAADALQTTRELATTFSFYTAPHYVFESRALMELAASFEAGHRQRFEVDARCYAWPHYIAKVHLPGLERFAVRSAPDDVTRTQLNPVVVDPMVDPALPAGG